MDTQSSATIIVVNDDPVQLHMTSGLLERDGMRVIRCSGAEEALKVLEQDRRVDAIVTDLHMPGIDGWRFCRLLRSPEYQSSNHIPILVISATFSGVEAEQITVDLGANAFLSAPYDPAVLRRYMRKLLQGEMTQSALRVVLAAPESESATSLKTAFEAHGCVVRLVADAQEAYRLCKAEAPEIAILDYDLEGLRDHQLLHALKFHGSSSVALVVTSDAAPIGAVNAMRAGADGYVRKPYEPAYLIVLAERARRERAFLRIQELLEDRTISLRESESRFRSLVEGIVEIILVCDREGMIRYVNESGAQRLGWTAEDLAGKPMAIILSGADTCTEDGPSAETQRGGEVPAETIYQTRSGDPIVVEVSRRPIIFNGTAATMTVARDVTERKRAQEERTKLEDQLRQSQKMEAIGTLAGGVAHDFNNLLTVILGHVHLFKMRTSPADEGYKDAATIEAVVYRAKALTEQLLGFARRGKHQNTVLDVRATIREVMTFLSRTLDKKIMLKEESGVEPATIMGDPGQLHQVILNLSVNARDAMSDGGIITYRTQIVRPHEDFRTRFPELNADQYVKVEVADTGCGIPRDVQKRIFEPFFTTKDHRSGTGMGLAMVYGIVQNHGGAIEVESEAGQGAIFRMYLPVAAQLDRRIKPRPQEPLVAGTGKILLVDDEDLVRKIAARLLGHLGYEVVMASDGREAVEYYRGHAPEISLVILDMIMPHMSGRECFLALRSINPNVKAVLVSGYDKNHGAQEILDDGVQGFLQKPYDLNKFSRVIADAIGSNEKPRAASTV